SEADAGAVAAIYAPYVRDTAISFETEPPAAEEMARRIRGVVEHAPWLVYERDGEVIAYAYAGRFHSRAAYQWTVETTVYGHSAHLRRGIGRTLYTALLDVLRLQGFRAAVGVIALPNPASVALHEQLGFRREGLLPAAGFKHGRWHDIGWWRLELQELSEPPQPPRPFAAVVGTEGWDDTLRRASARSTT